MSEQNELFDFLAEETSAVEREYDRIQRRVGEDAGTAGDQGEENWASILRKWLPAEYHVVTKGRILGHKGKASRQVDVLVLHPSYPPHLRDKKLYLAGGITAAFECKITFKVIHLKKAIENSRDIKRLTVRRTGTPYQELNSPLLYGLLAHSAELGKNSFNGTKRLTMQLETQDKQIVTHPREMLDLLCIADRATWVAEKVAHGAEGNSAFEYSDEGKCSTQYLVYHPQNSEVVKIPPMGILLLSMFRKLAWEDTRMRRLADYLSLALHYNNYHIGTSNTSLRPWALNEVYTPKVEQRLREWGSGVKISYENVYGSSGGTWNEWSLTDKLADVNE